MAGIGLCAVLVLAGAAAAPAWAGGLQSLAAGEMRNFAVSDQPRPAALAPFQDGAGETLDLSAFRGKVVLVNLWATWCAPCRDEMPALDRLQARLGGEDFQVVAVAEERGGPAKAQAFLEEIGAGNLNLYIDPTMRSARAWQAPGLPTSFLLDRQGREIGRLIGPAEWDSPDAVRLIEAALAKE